MASTRNHSPLRQRSTPWKIALDVRLQASTVPVVLFIILSLMLESVIFGTSTYFNIYCIRVVASKTWLVCTPRKCSLLSCLVASTVLCKGFCKGTTGFNTKTSLFPGTSTWSLRMIHAMKKVPNWPKPLASDTLVLIL